MEWRAMLNKKVAGVPAYWILLIVAAAGLYGAIKMKSSADTTDDGSTDPTDAQGTDASTTDEGDLPDTSQPVFAATPTIVQPTDTTTITGTPMADTNDAWGRRSIEYLTANGFTLSLASRAITDYLDGTTLSQDEGKARDMAVKQYGLPPEGLLPTSTAAKPVYKGPAAKQGVPALDHVVKGTSDNTFAQLARLYYGDGSAGMAEEIHATNVSLAEPFPPGTKVHVPAKHAARYYRATSSTHTVKAIAAKNGTTEKRLAIYNPGLTFPVKPGTRVRVR